MAAFTVYDCSEVDQAIAKEELPDLSPYLSRKSQDHTIVGVLQFAAWSKCLALFRKASIPGPTYIASAAVFFQMSQGRESSGSPVAGSDIVGSLLAMIRVVPSGRLFRTREDNVVRAGQI